MRLSRRNEPRPAGRSISPDDVGVAAWCRAGSDPLPAAGEDEATGSQVDWDELGRPVFTVFFASGRTQRFVDDDTARRAVEVFGVTRPPVRRPV